MDKSSYTNNVNILSNESLNNDDNNDNNTGVVIYDDADQEEDFTKKYKFSIEDIVERLTKEEFDFFYNQLKKQKVGKPNKQTLEQREKFAARIRQIKKELENE